MQADASGAAWPPVRRRIYLLRHADVAYFDEQGRPYRPATVPLTARGREQAAEAGKLLQGVAFDRAVSSGLRRTAETTRLVLAGRDVPADDDPRLREIETGRMSEWADPDPEVVREAILHALGDRLSPESRWFAGETVRACGERVLAAWADLLSRRDWRQVLVVAHGVVNRLLLCHLLGAPLSAVGKIEQDACCVNLVELAADGTPLVRLVNFTADDPAKRFLTLSTLEGLYQQYLQGRPPPPPPGA